MEEDMDKQKTWHDADDVSDSIFHFLRPGEDAEGNVTWPNLMPSLGHFSVVKIVTALWTRAVQHEMTIPNENKNSPYDCNNHSVRWKKIEDQVLADASEFILPGCIHKMLINAVKPIGKEISEWVDLQDEQIFYDYGAKTSVAVHYVGDLVWTSRGRIDQAKTAKVLLKKEELHNNTKYRIACFNCLEEEIIAIAPKVLYPGYLDDEQIEDSRYYYKDYRVMTHFWTSHLSSDPAIQNILQMNFFGEAESLTSTFFNRVITINSRPPFFGKYSVAVKYFWQKLSSEEKELYVERAIMYTLSFDDKLSFLKQVSEEVRDKMFRNYYILLSLISDWLWRDYFIPTVRLMWKDMSGEFYNSILCTLRRCMPDDCDSGEGYLDSPEKRMLMSFWECSPFHFKVYLLEHYCSDYLEYVLRYLSFCTP